MNKLIVLHGFEEFREAFRLSGLELERLEGLPSIDDALKYQVAFLMMSGYSAAEALALVGYGVKSGLVAKHGANWFLKLPNSELRKVLSAVRREGLGELGDLGIIPKRWLPRGLRKIQVGKAVGQIARNVVAPVAKVTGAVLTATGIGAPIGAALTAGGTLVGTLAKEGGAKASDVANAILGVAAAANGKGSLPTNVQKLVRNAVNKNPEIARVANQINAVVNNVNAAVSEMRNLIPKQSQKQLIEVVPPNFMNVSAPTSEVMETNLKTVTTSDMRAASRSATSGSSSGLNPAILIVGAALLGIIFLRK